MRPDFVIFQPPSIDHFPSVTQRKKPVEVQTLISEATVEALNETILDRFPGSNEAELDVVQIAPLVEYLARELWTVITEDSFWFSATIYQRLQCSGHSQTTDIQIHVQSQAFSGEFINHIQSPESPATSNTVGHEVHRPLLIWADWVLWFLPSFAADSPLPFST